MNRDILYIESEDIAIACDNCGSIGSLTLDNVDVSARTTANYSSRVVIMELLSIRSRPIACTLQIFNPQFYDEFVGAVSDSFKKIGIDVPIVTTTESNFKMKQTAFGITLIGKGMKINNEDIKHYAVLGTPCIGSEVLTGNVLPLNIFMDVIDDINISTVLPVGSSGIANELKNVYGKTVKSCNLDVNKSAGPSTCVIIGYNNEEEVKSKYEYYFNKLEVEDEK